MKLQKVLKLSTFIFVILAILVFSTNITAQPLDGWQRPGTCNTGPIDESALTIFTGTYKAQTDGEVIENIHVKGEIQIHANNVTIRNFIADGNGSMYRAINIIGGATGLVLEDGIIRNFKAEAIGYPESFTARRLEIYESEQDGLKAGSNTTIESCYIHHIGNSVGAHADGIQVMGGSNIKFIGNYISALGDGTGTPAVAPYTFHTAIIVQSDVAPVDNVLIQNNWLDNGSYIINGAVKNFGANTNVVIHNNHFGGNGQYGAISGQSHFSDQVDNLFDTNGISTMPDCENDALFLSDNKINTFSVYPNPSNNGCLHIDCSNISSEIISISVTDISGREVIYSKVSLNLNNTIKLDISKLNSGSYIITLGDKQVNEKMKFIIN